MALKPTSPKPISLDGFGLQPAFAGKLTQLLTWCQAHGLDFRISQGLRTPQIAPTASAPRVGPPTEC